MALTRDFRETIWQRAQVDPEFRREIFIGALNEFLKGDTELGKAMLRDYVKASVSYDYLAQKLNKNPKSIQRMLGPNGNPTAESFFSMIQVLQEAEGISLRVEIG